MSTAAEDQEQAEVLGWHAAEDVPDGTFGRARLQLPGHLTPCTPEEQARHVADLTAGISGFAVGPAIRRHTSPRRNP